jgi:acyl phosphate:glycerol-3-phosphate acyltransferase
MTAALPLALIVATYLTGSIPFSFLVPFALTGKDIRLHGSRNVGATNVARNFGRAAGVLALLLDMAKGYAAVELARWLVMRPDWPLVAQSSSAGMLYSRELWIAAGALIAVLGHMFPLWLRFHGGKGVATASGAFLALDPRVVLASIIIFVIVLLTTRFVSLASIIAAASVPVFFQLMVRAPFERVIVAILIAIAVIAKHHSNISRLVQGTERRMGERK